MDDDATEKGCCSFDDTLNIWSFSRLGRGAKLNSAVMRVRDNGLGESCAIWLEFISNKLAVWMLDYSFNLFYHSFFGDTI